MTSPSPTTTITTPVAPAVGTAAAPSTPAPAQPPPSQQGEAAAAPDAGLPAAPVEGADTGSWSEPGEATSRSGEGTSRNEHWRAARTVHGDRIGGDKVAGHKIELRFADKTMPLQELSPDLTEPVRYAFVNPENWGDLSERFRAHRSTIVRGRAGQGKDACAIRLLTGEVETIYGLDPEVDVNRLADSIAEQAGTLGGAEGGIGFLLCQPVHAAKLRGFTLQNLEKALTDANARLVITLHSEVHPADDELHRYVLDLPAQPIDHKRIITSHLSWRCNDVVAAKLLDNPTVGELIAELAASDASCRSAADLAAIISLERDEDGTVNGFQVRARHRQHREQAFDLWFDGLRGAEERSFAVALAVLDGLPYEEVSAAARRLRRKLEHAQQLVLSTAQASGPELRIARQDRLQTPTARLLQTLRAADTDEQIRYAYGTVPVRTVHYQDPDYPTQVIERAWRGYQIQPTLLEWLGELIVAASEPVRIYAASTLGMLARYSFDYLCTTVFHRWANSKDRRIREAVAYALREAAADPQLAASAAAVVTSWYANRQQPRMQATAARAYGAGVGSLGPAATIDRLGRLATIDEFTVALAVGDALADLILQDPAETAPMACTALLAWFTDGRRTRPAQLAFLILADSMVTWTPAEDGRPGTRWPTLLHLAQSVETLRGPLFALWQRAVAESILHEQAHAVLSGWAGLAEHDEKQLDVLLRLLRATVGLPVPDDRIRQILIRLAARWVEPETLIPLPRAHQAVMAQLAPGGN